MDVIIRELMSEWQSVKEMNELNMNMLVVTDVPIIVVISNKLCDMSQMAPYSLHRAYGPW